MIVFAGKQCFRFQFADVALRRSQFPVQVFQQVVALFGVGFLFGKTNVGLDVAGQNTKLLIGCNLIFGALPLAQDGLCAVLIVPEAGIGNARFQRFQALSVLRRVKDSSERA